MGNSSSNNKKVKSQIDNKKVVVAAALTTAGLSSENYTTPSFAVIQAALKLQKQARRRRESKRLLKEMQWKLFAELDTQNESEMVHLAVFFQILIDYVPTTTLFKPLKMSSRECLEIDQRESGGISLECIQLEDISHIHGDYQNYNIGKSPITIEMAAEIIEVYRRGGKLHTHTMMRILRSVYRLLKELPNVTKVSIAHEDKVTVVGDIHGNISDLLHILDESGLPSSQNKYVFNGDFVDRGDHSVEVVTLLFVLLAADPENVVLNRGNHEDGPICRVYGFQREALEKYDDLVFGMFVEVFKYIPLCTVINDRIFIVHGGLFHDSHVKIATLNDIPRHDFDAKPDDEITPTIGGDNPAELQLEYLKQLQRDMLWSDPSQFPGYLKNDRGVGVRFGPDITEEFMRNNRISMVIRSHECAHDGFELPYSDRQFSSFSEMKQLLTSPLLCTLFSASNYCSGGNLAAYMVIMPHASGLDDAFPIKDSNGLFFNIYRYKTSEAEMTIEQKNKMNLLEFLRSKRGALLLAFKALDEAANGSVTRIQWAEVMLRVTKIVIRWLSLIDLIVPKDCITSKSVNYKNFVASLVAQPAAPVRTVTRTTPTSASIEDSSESLGDLEAAAEGGQREQLPSKAIESMYGERQLLQDIYNFFDKDGSGSISREEFRQGCLELNKLIPDDHHKLTDVDHIMDIIDFDRSGSLSLNEIFEVYRLLDAADGSVDGVLSLAK